MDLDLRFLRAAFKTPITVDADVVRRGRRLSFLHLRVLDADGEPVADGMSTFFIESALGRAHPIGKETP